MTYVTATGLSVDPVQVTWFWWKLYLGFVWSCEDAFFSYFRDLCYGPASGLVDLKHDFSGCATDDSEGFECCQGGFFEWPFLIRKCRIRFCEM